VMPEASVGGMEEEPLDAAAVALEQTNAKATTTNSRLTDRAPTRIVRRDPPPGLLLPTSSSEFEGIRILARKLVAQVWAPLSLRLVPAARQTPIRTFDIFKAIVLSEPFFVRPRGGTATRTMSAPWVARAWTWTSVAATSSVLVIAIDWMETGEPQPMSTVPSWIRREGRRAPSRAGRSITTAMGSTPFAAQAGIEFPFLPSGCACCWFPCP